MGIWRDKTESLCLSSAFKELGLKINAEVNYKTVNFVDVTLNLTN
jgi:hypothetical protein